MPYKKQADRDFDEETEEKSEPVVKAKPKNLYFELVEVPTQHTIAIRSPEGETMSIEEGMVYMLNTLQEIKKIIG